MTSNVLSILVTPQDAPNGMGGLVGTLLFTAPEYIGPSTSNWPYAYLIGAIPVPQTSPYPTYPDHASAIAGISSQAATDILTIVNGDFPLGSPYYLSAVVGIFNPEQTDYIAAAIAASLPAALAFSSPAFSNITAATRLSTTRNAQVSYDIDATVAISVLAGQSVTAILTYADNAAMTTNPVIVSKKKSVNSGVLGLSQTNTLSLSGIVPGGKYRQVTFAVSGGAIAPVAAALEAAQEVLL